MNVTFKNKPVTLLGKEVKVGDTAPDFVVVDNNLELVSLKDFKGKKKLISVVPSIDTGVCDFQTRKLNTEAASLDNTVVLTISVDLPFAQKRWCGNAGLDEAITLSDYRELSFGKAYGVAIEELRLLSRSIFVLDENDKVVYVEYLKENSNHPDYESALTALKNI